MEICLYCLTLGTKVCYLKNYDKKKKKKFWNPCCLKLNLKKKKTKRLIHYLATCSHFQEDTSGSNVPYCYYGSDNSYSISDVQYTASGLVANLTYANTTARAFERSTSPISTLRLEVIYHSNDMLQFKVFLPVSGPPLAKFVLFLRMTF